MQKQNELSVARLVKMFDKSEQDIDGLAQSIKKIFHPKGLIENMQAERIAYGLLRLRYAKEMEQFFGLEATNNEGACCGDLSKSGHFKMGRSINAVL